MNVYRFRRTLPGAVLALVSITGCHPDRMTTTTPSVASDADAWSGGAVVLRSAGFTGGDTLPAVTIGSQSLPVRSFGGDSASATLPDTDGVVTLGVALRGGGRTLVQVRVRGLESSHAGPTLQEFTSVAPWSSGPAATALGFQNGALVLVNYATNLVSPPLAPDTGLTSACNWAPVPSATAPGLVTVHPASGQSSYAECLAVLAVPASPSAAPPDTGPQFVGPGSQLELGRGTWLLSSKYGPFRILRRSPDGSFAVVDSAAGAGPTSYATSPGGRRLVPLQVFEGGGAWGGIPVFDATVPAVAYTIPALTRAYSAAFTPEGDTLLVAGDSANEPVLLALAAGSGAVLARAQPSGGQFWGGRAIAVDPVRPWLYVGWQGAHGASSNKFSVDSFYVDVYDRRSLALVATLRPTATVIQGLPASQYFNDWVFVMDGMQRRLYLTATVTNAGVPSWVYEYDLMP